MPGRALVRGPYRGMVAARSEHPGDRVGRKARLVAEEHDDGVGIAGRRHSGAERGGLSVLPVLGHRDLRAAELERSAHPLGVVTEHDHDAVQALGGSGGIEGVLEQRAAVEVGELLRAAEAASGARREHHADDQLPTSWMRPLPAADSIPPVRPWWAATTSAMIDSAV